jgi:hypothetical protein
MVAMPGNLDQIEEIIVAASVNDPVVRLQSLEHEVMLIKSSIKKILMDIRERMNELENPLVISPSTGLESRKKTDNQVTQAKQSALEAREAALDLRESRLELLKDKFEIKTLVEMNTRKNLQDLLPEVPVHSMPDESPATGIDMSGLSGHSCSLPLHAKETLPLQKSFHIFCWTQRGVKKFGHSRLETLVESYRVMGYISKQTVDEVRQISCLMSGNIREEYEISPEDFVYEIYTLVRILSPHDTSLDRDMIEVMMEQRQQTFQAVREPGYMSSMPETAYEQGKQESFGFGKKDQEWMNLRARCK